jgi:excisionase family DNA binding protein
MTTVTTTATAPSKGALSAREAADYLGVSPKTLENWRARGEGPAYVRLGARVVYRPADLDKFLAKHLVR